MRIHHGDTESRRRSSGWGFEQKLFVRRGYLRSSAKICGKFLHLSFVSLLFLCVLCGEAFAVDFWCWVCCPLSPVPYALVSAAIFFFFLVVSKFAFIRVDSRLNPFLVFSVAPCLCGGCPA